VRRAAAVTGAGNSSALNGNRSVALAMSNAGRRASSHECENASVARS
jgi:hypothetical protein